MAKKMLDLHKIDSELSQTWVWTGPSLPENCGSQGKCGSSWSPFGANSPSQSF